MTDLKGFLDSCATSILRRPTEFAAIVGYQELPDCAYPVCGATLIYLPDGKTFDDYLAWQSGRTAQREARHRVWRETHPEVTP